MTHLIKYVAISMGTCATGLGSVRLGLFGHNYVTFAKGEYTPHVTLARGIFYDAISINMGCDSYLDGAPFVPNDPVNDPGPAVFGSGVTKKDRIYKWKTFRPISVYKKSGDNFQDITRDCVNNMHHITYHSKGAFVNCRCLI